MRFPATWTRYVGSVPAGKIALGADAFPVDAGGNYIKAPNPADNSLTARYNSINGWPCSRIVVAAMQNVASPVAVNIAGYVWEDTLGFWLQMPQSSTTITPGSTVKGSGVAAAPVYFDNMSLLDNAPTGSTLTSVDGSATFLFLVSAGAAPSGVYTFVAAPELTTKPF